LIYKEGSAHAAMLFLFCIINGSLPKNRFCASNTVYKEEKTQKNKEKQISFPKAVVPVAALC